MRHPDDVGSAARVQVRWMTGERTHGAPAGGADRPDLALVLRSFSANGVTRVMLTLARAFSESGMRVDLLALDGRDGPLSAEIPDAVRAVSPAPGRHWHALLAAAGGSAIHPGRLLGLLQLAEANKIPSLARYLHARRPRAVLAGATHASFCTLMARRIAKSDARIVVSQHNHLGEKTKRLDKRWKRTLSRAYLPAADGIVAVSDGVARDLVARTGLDPGAVTRIYNPIVSDQLLRQAAQPVPHPWLAPRQPPVVLGAGRLKPRKDFALLIRAFARLRSERACRLMILGEGPEAGALYRLAGRLGVGDDVELVGFTPNPYAYMARAGCFALTSRWEGFANVLVEALASGCAVVSTDCPSGPAEILDDGRFGRLVPVGNPRALASALSGALDQPRRPALHRARGLHFSVDAARDAYAEVLGLAARDTKVTWACGAG